ncbi:hypothetical protein KOI35_03710 [Actinoplanes bogorensis]|uniref:Secreted protein n=1 Tax=Paractinoplanes bogorensis TaxID=1610840 RepID=A0ABS5YGJ4_9ACTN|nr:hypothetical protein [Actinoplanes bogorensis]MBU2662604.1 hypothetical protein [Actinoplanes bogorensis]
MISARKIMLSGLLALGMVTTMIPSAAQAAVGSTDDESGMRIGGFDAAVARANGYEIVTLPDGSQASVPAAKAEAARRGSYVPKTGVLVKPSKGGVSANAYGSRSGNCGTSWVQISPRGGGSAGLTTGMSLVLDSGGPWDIHWNVNVSDRNGTSNQYYDEDDGYVSGTGLSWAGKGRTLNLARGSATVKVTAGSFTITGAGWVCFSYAPGATDIIT